VANLVGVSGCPREGTNFCPGRGYGHCSRLPAVEMGRNMKNVTLSEWDIVFRSATTKRGSPSVAALKERHGKLTKSYNVSNVRKAITRVMAKVITPAQAVRSHTLSGSDATEIFTTASMLSGSVLDSMRFQTPSSATPCSRCVAVDSTGRDMTSEDMITSRDVRTRRVT